MSNKRILFFVTEDWYFCSHRLPVARGALKSGLSVYVVTNVNTDLHRQMIINEGFNLIPIRLDRQSVNPFKEIRLIQELVKIYKSVDPDLIHHVAIKPIIYGSIAAKINGFSRVVNAFPGLGFIFISNGFSAWFRKWIIVAILRICLTGKTSFCLFQNFDDQKLLIQAKVIDKRRAFVIKGSGVDVKRFTNIPEPEKETTITLISRMLWQKGIAEYVKAAEIINRKGISCKILLVGEPDIYNPSSIPIDVLHSWDKIGYICWLGKQSDIVSIISRSNIIVLPSYGEGLPKALLEAASCGRAIIATDVPGCREICKHNFNGLLVPPHNVDVLAVAMERLIMDKDLRRRFGENGRQLVLEEFSEEIVVQKTLELYNALLAVN